MKIYRFEDIIGWQKGQDLAVEIYSVFGKIKDFGFRDQICRAAVSISNNIAEGYDRSSDADFCRFLYIAIGSSSELRSMMHLAARLGYINEEQRSALIAKSEEVSRILKGFIKTLQK